MATNVPFERAVRWGVGLGVSAAAAIASLVLVSWVSGHWMAGTFGPGYLPMAPSTALAVLALGIAILLLLRPTFSRVSAAFGWSSVLLALLSCTLSLALPVLGSDSFLSVWLSPVKFEIGGVPAGVMSPLTAVVLFLLAAALALHLPPFGRQRALRQAAALLALTGGAICAVVMLGYLFDSPLLYGTRTVPMALPTGAALTLLALGLVITSGPATWPASLVLPDRGRGPLPWPARGPFAALLTLSAAILITGGCHLSTQMANMRQAARTELDAVANLKKEQIAGWRQERMNDARFFSNAAFVSRDIQALLEHPKDESVRGETLNWLTLLKGGERYTSAAIVDPRGDVLLSVPPQKDGAGDPRFSALVRDTVAGNAIQLTDLHPDDAGGMHLDLTVPVHAPEAGRAAAPPIAVIALRMNPAHFLFPLLQKWPSPVETAETLLVRREGDEVVILNEPRHHTGAAMRRRFSVDTPDLPSAMAVRGVTGIGEGVDYRGVRVVAVARRVPDSDWYLVAKEDKSEIYAASWRQAIRVAGIMALLLLAGTLFILALWRQRNLEYYRDRLEQERQRTILAQRFEHLMRQASDLIVITGADGRIVEINDRAVQAYGFSPGELCGTDLSSLRTEAARPAMGAQMRELEDQGSAFFETEHRRADGTAFPVEISARLVDIGGAQHRLFIVRDITERREREQEIDRLNRMYAALSRVNQAIVRSAAEAELLAQVCGALVDEAGFRIAWTGRYDPESGTVRQRAWHGKCCLDAVEVAFLTDGGDTGKSPVITTAVRGDCVVVCRDLSASPSSPDVRLRIDAVGITAAAVFPIHLRGEIWGVLAVGASEPGCFGDREIALLEEAAQDLSFALEHLAGELERRQAGEAVRRSEQNLAMAEEIAHVGYWERAVDGGILHWSDEAYRIFGLEPQERPMNLSSFLAMVHPEDRGSVEEAIRATREEDRPYNVEYRIVRPGGAVRFVHSQGELLLDSMGQSERMFGTMLDVTERKWTEQALRESKRQATELADMLQNASQPFCVGYPDGRLGVSNGAMQAMLGYTAEEITALDWANDVTPAEWLDLERAQLARLHDTGIPVRYEKEYIRKDGTRVPVELLVHLLRDEGGAPRQYYAFITDITERKCAEGKLRESEQRFRMIAENTGDVIWRLDAATRRFTYISPSILRLRGFTPEEAMSQDIRSSLTPESHEKLSRHILERVAAFKAGDESARIMMQEVRQPHKNGSILTTEVVSTLIVNGQGAITEILGVTRDITARKRAEEALRESERHYRIIAENTGDVIWQLDLASMRFTYVSPSVLRLRGYTPEEVMAQPVEAALTPDSVVTMVQGIADYLSAPPEEQSRRLVNTSIVRQPCKDGSIVTTEAVTTVLTDGQGGITGVLGVSRDITERVRAEEALRTSEQRFRAAFEDGLF